MFTSGEFECEVSGVPHDPEERSHGIAGRTGVVVETCPGNTRHSTTVGRIAFTAFMAVLIPVYWYWYGPTNFLYFCDIALILRLVAVWIDSPLLVSMSAVGILVPQIYWGHLE